MKWTHPKCSDEDFISEWQATEDACELAMDFDITLATMEAH